MNRVIRFFTPDNQDFYRLFQEAGDNLCEGARLLESLLTAPRAERNAIVKQIGRVEHKGDQIISTILERLDKTFVTPFEREDIYELASTLDDILDTIEDAADYVIMYQLNSIRPHAVKQAALIAKMTTEINSALKNLKDFKHIFPYVDAIKELESTGDKLVRTAMADLFKHEERPKRLIAWKSMFDVLERTLNIAEHHANVLKGIAVKNS